MSEKTKKRDETSPARILVAEDEALIRLDLVEMLTEAGYEVVAQATNGLEAIALAKEIQTRFSDSRCEDARTRWNFCSTRNN